MKKTKQDSLKELTNIYNYLLLFQNLKVINQLLQTLFYHKNIEQTNLVDMNARLYDPEVGSVMMGASGAAGGSATANGALTGFTTGFISSGGELDQAVENGIISSASAFMANEIGHGTGKEWDWTTQAVAHGVSQGVINELRGQSFKSGFISGVVGKVGGHYAVKYGGNPIANASIIGVFSGIASRATGGDFYEGAMRGAFVYLYNDYMDKIAERVAFGDRKESKLFKNAVKRIDKDMIEPMRKLGLGAKKIGNGLSRDIPKAYQNAHPSAKGVLWVSGGIMASPVIYTDGVYASRIAMTYPEAVIGSVEFIESYLLGIPSLSYSGLAGFATGNVYGWEKLFK